LTYSGDITLGSILTIVTLVSIAITLGRRLGSFETTLKQHADTMVQHSARLTNQESRVIDLVASVQRLIGQMEVRTWEHKRWTDEK
jgi:hypothetical protein